MVRTEVKPIDGDGHILENPAKLLEYMDEPFKGWRKNGLAGLMPRDGWDRYRPGIENRGGSTTDEWTTAMGWGGLEYAFLYPTMGLFTGFLKDPDYAAAFAKSYNRWLAEDICQPSDGKLVGVALLAPHDADAAAKELRRAKAEYGFSTVMMCADGNHLLGHKSYDQVYQAAAELDVAVAIHASGFHLGGGGVDMFPKFIQAHTASHPFGILRQFTSMMFEGIFEKFPTVRFAFLEAGGTWVPWWLDRMNEEYEHRGDMDALTLTKPPRDYVHKGGNIFFGCEPGEGLLGATMDYIGDDIVMYATDYPHWDGDYPESLEEMKSRPDLTEVQRYNLLRGAAARFYKLDD